MPDLMPFPVGLDTIIHAEGLDISQVVSRESRLTHERQVDVDPVVTVELGLGSADARTICTR